MTHDKDMSDARAWKDCPNCQEGYIMVGDICANCNGSGQIDPYTDDPRSCAECNGTGRIKLHWEPCPTCAAFYAAIDAAIASNNPLCAYDRCKKIDEAVAGERERCARIADKHSMAHTLASENADVYHIQNAWATVIAAAIRATKEQA